MSAECNTHGIDLVGYMDRAFCPLCRLQESDAERYELLNTLSRIRSWAEEELPLNPDTEWFKGYEAALRSLLSLAEPVQVEQPEGGEQQTRVEKALREIAAAPEEVDGYWLRKLARAALSTPPEPEEQCTCPTDPDGQLIPHEPDPDCPVHARAARATPWHNPQERLEK